jgi:hypothetical protein
VVAGALIGLVIGLALSLFVGVNDARKRQDGLRSRAQYRGSLVLVPVILAGIGAVLGAGLSKL